MYRCPKVLLFDLGKVLLNFSHDQMCQQVADRYGVSQQQARDVLFSPAIHLPYERGEISTSEVLQHLNQALGGSVSQEALIQDLGDIFSLNTPMVPILMGLKASGWKMGILSNTCDAHWVVAHRKFGILNHFFDFFATSFQLGEVKPMPAIYQAAAKLAQCELPEILFVDDLLENVEAARETGLDAVLYTSPSNYAADLRRRGVVFNY